jgi:tetratricopeptide (TPR) repeat protein
MVRANRSAVLIFLLGFSFASAFPATEYRQEVKDLIAARQLDAAEKIIVSELVTTPHDPDWITELAAVRLDQGRTPEALALIDDAEKLGGVTASRAQLAGLAQTAAGRLELAEPQFRTAIRLDPNYATAHYFLARLLYTKNHFDEAIQESKAAIALSPGMVRAYENVGLCYEGKQDDQEAERWYLEAIRRESSGSKTEWPMLDLAILLMHNNRLTEAKQYLSQAIAINPANPQSVLQMGILLEKSGDLLGALREFRDSIQLDPDLAGAYYHAARVCQKLHHADEAQLYFVKFKQVQEEKH